MDEPDTPLPFECPPSAPPTPPPPRFRDSTMYSWDYFTIDILKFSTTGQKTAKHFLQIKNTQDVDESSKGVIKKSSFKSPT